MFLFKVNVWFTLKIKNDIDIKFVELFILIRLIYSNTAN